MRLLIKSLMPRPKPASRLYPGPGRWILDASVVNNPPRRRIRTLGIKKRISLLRILLLMHRQVGLNPLRHSPKRNRTVVLAKENSDNGAKARILLPLTLTPLLSGKIRTRIRTRKTYPTLSATPASRKVIIPTSVPRKSQKTSVSLNDLHVGD